METESLTHRDEGNSFLKVCFNGLNILTGIGMLSIPYALSEGGWISLIALFVIAILCFYTGTLLERCMGSNPRIRSYPDIGEQAFGTTGRVVISVILYLELYLLAVEFLIMGGDNLHKLFPDMDVRLFGKTVGGEQAFIVVTALVVLPTMWLRSLELLSYVSASGILATLLLFVSVLWIGVFEDVGFKEKGVVVRFRGLPTTVSLYTFCYCGHSVFPTLLTSMDDRKQFKKVLLVCFSVTTIMYGSMAVIGYLMYGEYLMSQITLNLPTDHLSSKIAIYTTLILPITKYALIVSPITAALEETLTPNNSVVISLVIRTVLLISTVVIGLVVPFFAHVMAFIGAFSGVSASILFPCLCYLKISRVSRKFRMELMFILMILVVGVFVAGVGTFTAVKKIVKSIRTER